MSSAASPAGSTNLPAPLTPLVGREREVAALVDFLRRGDVRLLTLTGPGGVGKTRLALTAAADVGDAFRSGVHFVSLAPITDPDLVASAIAQVLGVQETGGESLTERLRAFLRDKRLLLVLDNFEQVVEAAPLVANLLEACPDVTALVTSRLRLRLSGEQEYPVPPLGLPVADGPMGVQQASGSEAVRLFVQRAQAVNPDFTLTEMNAQAVLDVCRQVDGLPLAIELAAARVKVLPPALLLGRLQRRLPLLTGGGRDLPTRQQTMRDTIAWSYDLLTSPEQALFRRLAVFVGGFSLEAAEDVGGAAPPSVLDVIAALLDSSLLRQEPGPGGEPRYRMLETVREYGLEQLELAARDEEQTARAAHAAFCLVFAARAAPDLLGGNPVIWLDRLAVDHDNLRAALDWLCAGDTPRECLRLAGACAWYWYRRGHVQEGRARLGYAIANAGPEPTAALGRAIYWAAELATRAGDIAAATSFAQDARAVSGVVGDPLGRALAIHAMARIELYQDHWDTAAMLYEEELPVWRETGDPRAIGMVLVELGEVAFGQGELAQAQVTMLEAAEQFRNVDERTWLAVTDLYLALFAVAERRFAEAARLYRACLTGYAETGDAFLQSPLAGLARVAIEAGRPTSAAQLLGAADAQLQRTGMRFDQFERLGYEEAEAGARTALGEVAFTTAYESGRTLSRDAWFAAADDIVSALEAEVGRQGRGSQSAAGLTRREREILSLVADGLSDRAIAEALFIGQGTVRSHLTSIFGKLEVGSRTAAVATARHLGIL